MSKEADELAFRLKQALNWIESRPYGWMKPQYDVPGETIYGIRVYGHKAIASYEHACASAVSEST